MLELAEHILDIAENSIRAGAKTVEIIINEDTAKDLLSIEINDDGSGMTKEAIKKAFDPFYTRRYAVGLVVSQFRTRYIISLFTHSE